MVVYVVYSKLDDNYGSPFKVFKSRDSLEDFLKNNKDGWGLEYCWDELEVED